MKISALILLVATSTGCIHYTAKRISMPHTEESAACAADALTDYEQCIIHQRGRGYCEKLRDTLFLRCPGAREEGEAPKSTNEQTPQLPPRG